MFAGLSQCGIVGRANNNNLYELNLINPRDFTTDNYRRIDDKTFGGGAGMVMKIEPLELALASAIDYHSKRGEIRPMVIYMSPQGKKVDQSVINQLAKARSLVFVCGRYEGVDERFIDRNVDLELSIGDFVVSGGEIPAMLVIDGIVRQIPGAMNSQESVELDSFMNGLLDCPHYTTPRDYNGVSVPVELLSGNHKMIRKWRLQQSLWRTYQRRPDLINSKQLTQEESRLLTEMISRNKTEGKKE